MISFLFHNYKMFSFSCCRKIWYKCWHTHTSILPQTNKQWYKMPSKKKTYFLSFYVYSSNTVTTYKLLIRAKHLFKLSARGRIHKHSDAIYRRCLQLLKLKTQVSFVWRLVWIFVSRPTVRLCSIFKVR